MPKRSQANAIPVEENDRYEKFSQAALQTTVEINEANVPSESVKESSIFTDQMSLFATI